MGDAMTPEGKVKQDVKDYLETLGKDCWYYMPVPMGYGKRGVPDFIICYKGFLLAPETKRDGGKSKPWQEREQAAIRAAGGASERVIHLEWLKIKIRAIDDFWKWVNVKKDTKI